MSTIGIIQGTDVQSVSRTTINDNFTNLNTDKADKVVGLQQFASTTSDQLNSVISDSLGEGSLLFGNALDFYKYSIVTSVASGNLTVALKNFEGNDPTATKPVKIQIGGVIRTITSAKIATLNAATNWFNLGSAELATKEVDIFVYLGYTDSATVDLAVSRVPYAICSNEFTQPNTTEKGFWFSGVGSWGQSATEFVVNIGRFNATLSAGGAYTWSIPATSVIINSPCYETRDNDFIPTLYGSGGTAGTFSAIYEGKYRIRGNQVFFQYKIKCTDVGSWAGQVIVGLPISPKVQLIESPIAGWVAQQGTNPATSSKASPIIVGAGDNTLKFLTAVDTGVLTWGTFVVNDHIRVQGFYNI